MVFRNFLLSNLWRDLKNQMELIESLSNDYGDGNENENVISKYKFA